MAFFRGAGSHALGWLAAAALAVGQGALACQRATAQQTPPPIAAPDPAPARPTATSAVAGGLYAFQGLPVQQVEIRGVSADQRVLQQLHQLLAQNVNEPLDRQKIGRSVRALYATGRFADVQVEAQKTPQNQVALVFVATENLFVSSISVNGAPKRPSSTQLVDATKLQLGHAYAAANVERSMAQMKTVLADNGYYQATITEEEERHPETQQIDLRFHVEPGPVARVGQIIVEGSPGVSDEEIRAITKLHSGDTVSSERLTRALTRLRKRYSKQSRLEAQISLVDRRYHADTNHLDYIFRIVRGPKVDISVAGADVSHGKLKKYVPVYEEHAVDDDLLNEGRRNLRDYLQTEGYFDAQVDFSRRANSDKDTVSIAYTVEKGPKHDLSSIYIDGNNYFDNALIRERMAIQPTSLLMQHGRYSQELLNSDLQNIRDLYLANGFEHAEVTAEVKDDYQGQKGRMAVFVHVKEGPQTLVSAFNIEGEQVISEDELRPLLTILEGQPYSEANVATDRDSILNYYFNRGFPDVVFTSSARQVPGDPTKENVTYTIEEGPQVFVDRVLFTGLKYTRPGIVRRQFRIAPQEPLSQLQMLESQRRLYDLGIFTAVGMAVANPEGQARYKDVYFQFEEARRWTFNYGFGLEIQTGALGTPQNPEGQPDVSPRVSLDITRLNFGGRAHTLTLSSHVGRLEQRGLISYDAPRFMNHDNLRLTLSAFYDNSLDVRTFTSQRLEGSVQFEQVWTKATSLLYRFTYRRVRASNLVIAPSLIPLFSLPVRVGMPSLTYIRDRRDDPIDTHNGNYNTFDTGVASGVFGSEAAFGRFLGQNATYHPIKRRNGWVFARSLRLGFAQPFGDTVSLPLPERFFAGGGNSLRGFGLNQAGPRDPSTGEPLGGNAMVVNNFELRTPSFTLPFVGGGIGFVVFHDAGNVFATTKDMSNSLLHWTQPDRDLCRQAETASQCSFNYISHALGTGVRYKTPIGPVRLDVGYNLNPPTFPVFTTDKATNTTTFRSRTLGRFNFYFSIGQTF